MGAGAEEKLPGVGVGFFRAAVWGTYFCDSFQTQLGLQVKQLTALLQQKHAEWAPATASRTGRWGDFRSEELPSQISTENDCWRDAARGTEIRPPALRWRRNTTPPADPNVFQTLSSAHNAAIARRRVFTPRVNSWWLPWPPQWCSGYLAASATAWRDVHDPTLQAPPPGVVGTAVCTDIVELRRKK